MNEFELLSVTPTNNLAIDRLSGLRQLVLSLDGTQVFDGNAVTRLR